jgi:hypothetical protein
MAGGGGAVTALTTSRYRMRRFRACHSYAHLVEALGPDFGDKAPINLLTILDLNGVEDCLWAMRATDQDSDAVAGLMAADFAEAVSPIFGRYPKSEQPKTLLDVARAFALGQIDATEWEAAKTAQAGIIEKYLTK